jgi:hypothetical protein
MAFSSRRRLPVWLALLALSTSLVVPVAQAQSAYILTTLKIPSPSTDERLNIDTSSRVTGTVTLLAGFRSDSALAGLPGPYYKNYMGQWAVSTAGATVSHTKVSNTSGFLYCASPDGSKLVSEAGLYDRAANKFQTMPLAYASGVNNAGKVVGIGSVSAPAGAQVDANNSDAYARATTWSPGQAATTLLTNAQFPGARAFGVNNAGVVAGAVYGAQSTLNTRAARWVNGVLEVLENQPGKGSLALDVSDGGQVLMLGWDTQVVRVPLSDTQFFDRVDQINTVFGVFANGAYTPIVSNMAGYTVYSARGINSAGTVIGVLGPDQSAGSTATTRRAYIWQNGLMRDLTTLVASKGVKLPTGAVLNNVVAINDQGSLVAAYNNPKTQAPVYVRLQAKP